MPWSQTMKILQALRMLIACLAIFDASTALAAISCSATASSVQANYVASSPNPTDGTWSVTVNCTRSLGDPLTSAYTLRVDDGAHRPPKMGTNWATNGNGNGNRMT